MSEQQFHLNKALNISKIDNNTSIEATNIIPKYTKAIQNKFGNILINEHCSILFPHGIIGMPNANNFVLALSPLSKFPHYILLQSLQADNLVFLTFPLARNQIIQNTDIQNACQYLDINYEDSVTLLLVSIDKITNDINLNARAPIIIDSNKRTGFQYLLQDQKYPFKLFIENIS